MSEPLKPSFSVAPPTVVATNQTVTLAVWCAGAESLAAYVIDSSETPVWSGSFDPVAQSGWQGALFSADVPLSEAGVSAGSYEFRVQGVNGDGFGPNACAAFEAYDPPRMSIAYPPDGHEVGALPLYVIWNVSDDTGVASQVVTVTHGSDVIARTQPDPSVRQVSWHASEMPLEEGETYRVEVSVVDGVGLAASATSTFTTLWEAPATPGLEIAPDQSTATVTVTATCYNTYASAFVWRLGADGSRTLLGSGSPSVSVTDPLPPLGVPVSYEARVIHDETGATSAAAEATACIRTRAWALNYGSSASGVILLRYNPKSTYSLDQGGEAYHFADGGEGGGLPVWYGTTDREESGTLTFEDAGPDFAHHVVDVLRDNPVCWLRDPFGRRWLARVRPRVSHGVGGAWQVTLDWDAMRWEEA